MNVDWVCQSCGDYNRQPRNDPPRGACLACGEIVGWVIKEDDR
jgi:hypothetical protein